MYEFDPPPLLPSGVGLRVVGGSIRPDDLPRPSGSVNHGLIVDECKRRDSKVNRFTAHRLPTVNFEERSRG
jgi:hypothetical protein